MILLWRQQARILAALPALAAGRPVTETAHALGYETTSAFAAMFRQVLGTAPRHYFGDPR
ncbi:helix-turn-helix domain-containing protein [Methylorubrum zatmanii]